MLLNLQEIDHSYPGVRALKGVSFELAAGEIHALVGENGAGKSTLINVITGAIQPSSGSYLLNGRTLLGNTPSKIRALGVSTVYQEFSLAPDLTVLENLFLAREHKRLGILDRRRMRQDARTVLAETGFEIDLSAVVGELSRAQQQMVEILKALIGEPKVLILDEPTASLSDGEAEKLFAALEQAKARGIGITYVTHRMAELVRLADRATILRDGEQIATVSMKGLSPDKLVELMTGRKVETLFPEIVLRPGTEAIRVAAMSTSDGKVRDVSLDVRFGEVTGIAGLVGCGKSEVARAIYGHVPIRSGEIYISGERVARPDILSMLKRGVMYFPANRNEEGLALSRPIYENVTITSLQRSGHALTRLSKRSEIASTARLAERFRLKAPNVAVAAGQLSGGNRQKVLLARGLTSDVDIFIFDEPTVGIDVGARQEVYQFIKEIAEAGKAVLIVSSELPEIMGLCHRAYVMARGRVVSEHAGSDVTEATLLDSFFAEPTQ